MATPIRRCCGCGRRAPKAELRRFVAVDGVLEPDPTGSRPGRGAYTCQSPSCFERAVARRAFSRALRRPVRVPERLQAVWTEV